MPLFQEIDPTTFAGGRVVAIEPGSVAAAIGLRPGDELLAINDEAVEDVIDVQFHGAEEELELLVRRDGEYLLFEAERDYDQTLGLVFAHPTFDVDIRRCNNLCPFCFVLQMAPKFRRTLYVKDDDYRYSFLFGHFVTLTNLSDHDWGRIELMRLSPLYVSVHVSDTELRRQFLRNATAPDVMEQLRWLAARHIEVHTQLVIVPGFNDGEWLARSIRELAELWPADGGGGVLSISVVPVGLTRHHKYGMRPYTPAEASSIAVSVEPGPTALAVTLSGPSSAASDRTSPATPALDALYAASWGMPRTLAADASATNLPLRGCGRCNSAGTAAWASFQMPPRLTSTIRSHAASGVRHCGSPPQITPAAPMAASKPPKRATASDVAASSCPWLRTSASNTTVFGPQSAATASSSSRVPNA